MADVARTQLTAIGLVTGDGDNVIVFCDSKRNIRAPLW
jgi:hypothetical protein